MNTVDLNKFLVFPPVCYYCLGPEEAFVDIQEELDVFGGVARARHWARVPACRRCAGSASFRFHSVMLSGLVAVVSAFLLELVLRAGSVDGPTGITLLFGLVIAIAFEIVFRILGTNHRATIERDGEMHFDNRDYQALFDEANREMTSALRLKCIIEQAL